MNQQSKWLTRGVLVAGLLLSSFGAWANSCWSSNVTHVEFGTVGPAGGSAVGSFSVTCQKTWSANPVNTHFRLCLSIPGGVPINTTNPRRMSNYVGGQLQYELYSNPAHSVLIGTGTPSPVYTTTLNLNQAGNQQGTVNFPVYGRVFPGQAQAAGNYQSQNYANIHWVVSNTSMPPASACQTGSTISGVYQAARATWENSCAILSVNNLAFGIRDNLTTAATAQSTLSITCPSGTPWQVGMNNGLAFAGGTRRMARSGNTAFINYGLFQNSTHTTPWGSTIGTNTRGGTGTGSSQAMTIYGRVPVQTTPLSGAYEDTVQVTLTY